MSYLFIVIKFVKGELVIKGVTKMANSVESEMKGDGADDPKIQFEPCKYKDKDCKYYDNYGNCIFENCRFDQEELPPTVTQWWFTCLICHKPDSIDPKHMKAHFCKSCIDRMNEAEVLPFTCRYCGRSQNHPSQWMFSRVCDDCIPKLYDPNCKKYSPKR